MRIEAFGLAPEHRGDPTRRLIGFGPMSAGFVNDIEQVRRGLRGKFGHYGELDAPFVVAVLGLSPGIDREDVEQILFGRLAVQFNVERPADYRWVRQRDGAWVGPWGSTGRNVAAVLMVVGLHTASFVEQLPELWINPWAKMPLRADLPFATARVDDEGKVVYSEPTARPHEVLSLPEEWPGPERAFE